MNNAVMISRRSANLAKERLGQYLNKTKASVFAEAFVQTVQTVFMRKKEVNVVPPYFTMSVGLGSC